jgi:hypothetical protein
MAGPDEHVTGACRREQVLDPGRAEDRRPVGEEARRGAPSVHGPFERARDLGSSRPEVHPLEAQKAASVVVDDAEDPHRQDAEHPHEGEVGAPELQPSPDANAPRLAPVFFPELGHERAAADEDLPEGFAGGGETEGAGGEEAELPGAEVRLLYVEAHHRLFDVARGPVPAEARSGSSCWALWRWRRAGARPARRRGQRGPRYDPCPWPPKRTPYRI